jgi:hypothetical protein
MRIADWQKRGQGPLPDLQIVLPDFGHWMLDFGQVKLSLRWSRASEEFEGVAPIASDVLEWFS